MPEREINLIHMVTYIPWSSLAVEKSFLVPGFVNGR